MSRLGTYAVLALLVTSGLAGCIAPEDLELDANVEDGSQQDEASVPDQDPGQGRMTAEEDVEETEGQDDQVPPFYARRTVTVSGIVSLDQLPAMLATTDGDVTVSTGTGDSWELVATLEGRGHTPEEAQRQRDALSLEWGIGTPGAHRLDARVQEESLAPNRLIDMGSTEGTLELVLPADLLTHLRADSTDGDLTISDLRAGTLVADTTDGDVTISGATAASLRADSTDGDLTVDASDLASATLDTTDGDITATLTPAASGELVLDSTDGSIQLTVPEDRAHGYDLEAESTDGSVDIHLTDGTTRSEADEDDDGAEKTFQTTGYRERAIRTEVQLDTTDGDVTVHPA